MLARKMIAAMITGSLFVTLMGLIMPFLPDPIRVEPHYFLSLFGFILMLMMYGFPIILVYGVLASIISDTIANLVAKMIKREGTDIIISGILHILFGYVGASYGGLTVSVLFFIVDRLLQKQQKGYTWLQAIKSLLIPLALFVICMIGIRIFG